MKASRTEAGPAGHTSWNDNQRTDAMEAECAIDSDVGLEAALGGVGTSYVVLIPRICPNPCIVLLDAIQITHLIRVRQNSCYMTLLGRFWLSCFSSPFLSYILNLLFKVLGIH